MHHFKVLFAALAATLAAVAVTLPASASVGVSSIYSAGANACVAADTVKLGAPVTLAPCDPSDPGQQWAFNPTGAFHLVGTDKFIVSSTAGSVLGPAAQATDFIYVNHELAGDGYWLTERAGDSEPFLAPDGAPDSQAFYVFTTVK